MKTINYVLLLVGMIGFTTCYSQTNTNKPPVKIWDKTFGGTNDDGIDFIIPATDVNGGFILLGSSFSNISGDKSENCKERSGFSDYWIIKIDSSGKKEWDKTFGGEGHDFAKSVTPTMDGGYIIVGESFSGKSGDKTKSMGGLTDAWVVKINRFGKFLWEKSLGGNKDDSAEFIVPTSDLGFIIAGHSNSDVSGDKTDSNKGKSDYWIIKIDSLGNRIWDKTFGGRDSDELKRLLITSKNEFFLIGNSYSDISNDKSQHSYGNVDYWILKTDSLGNKIWDKTFGSSEFDYAYSACLSSDDNLIIAGNSSSNILGDKTEDNKGNGDFWIIKINNDGKKIWDKTLGGNNAELVGSIILEDNDCITIAGESRSSISGDKTEISRGDSDYWIVKIDSDGHKLWDKTLGGNDYDRATSIIKTSVNNYLIGGSSYSKISGDKMSSNKGSTDYWLVKLGFQ